MRKPPTPRAGSRRSGARPKATDAYHHGDLRHALIEAACAQVDRDGPDSLSLAGLAKSLGVSQPAPYRHFPDRNALLAAVATRGFREFAERLQEAADAGPKATALSRMGRAYVAFGTKRRGIYRLMFASAILKEAAADQELGTAARGSFALLVNALGDASGAHDRERRALQIWVALHGVVMLVNQGFLQDDLTSVRLPELLEAILAT